MATPGYLALQTAVNNCNTAGNTLITAIGNTTTDADLAPLTATLTTLATNLSNASAPPAQTP